MAGMGQWGATPFGAPEMSPFGAMPQPGGYQPSPETLMLLEQLKRGGQGQSPLGQPPAPEAQPPGMVSPYAFAGGAGQMGQSVPAGAMGQMPPGLGTSLSPGAGQVTPASPDMPAPGASPSGPAPMPGQTAPGGMGPPGANGESYESIQRKRKFAEALLQQGMSSTPIQSWTQGANRLAQALIGGYQVGQANKSEKEQAKQFQETMLRALGMGGTPAQAGATPSPQNGAAQPPNGTLAAYAQAVAKVESGGRYDAMGPQTKSGDRAYGKYQVMGNNIPSWTKEVLGQSMTPQQFLANPQAQDAVFNQKFRNYMAQFGNANDAISMWFSGKPLSAAGNRSDGYNTVPQYLRKVLAALPGGGQAAAGSPAAPSAPAQMPQAGGMNPQAMMMAAMMNPSLSPQQKQTMMAAAQMAAQQGKVNYQTLPDGTILALDPNGRRPPTPVYQAAQKPVALGENQRLVNPATGQTVGGPQQQATTYTTPDGRTVPLPTEKKAREAALGVLGKQGAEAVMQAPDAIAAAKTSMSVIDQIIGKPDAQGRFTKPHPGMGSVVGSWQQYIPSRPGGQAADFESLLGQIKGGAFLEAFKAMRGGGAISNAEGAKAEQAIARLDTKQSPEAFMRSLQELRGIMERGLQKWEAINRGGKPAPVQQLPGGWSVEVVK